jgi:diacylglycerol kinase (ATP)
MPGAEEGGAVKNPSIHRRFANSVAGIRDGWRRERSFRTHLGFSAAGLAMLCAVRPEPGWWLALLLALALGLAMELMNGAVEALADHLHPEVHPGIRVVKDMASGAVLLVNLGAMAVAAAILAAL